MRPSWVYTIVIVCLSRAIKGDVSLLSLACSSQGKQVLGLRVKLCSRCEWTARLVIPLCSVEGRRTTTGDCSYKEGDLLLVKVTQVVLSYIRNKSLNFFGNSQISYCCDNLNPIRSANIKWLLGYFKLSYVLSARI